MIGRVSPPFRDRQHAGRVLADRLGAYANRTDLIVLALPRSGIDHVIAVEQRELDRRERLYRGDRPFPDLHHLVGILVDDGLATGSTMRAAAQAVRQHRPAKVVVAGQLLRRKPAGNSGMKWTIDLRRRRTTVMAKKAASRTSAKRKWVRTVKTDSTHPPRGTYTGSAAQIARTMARKDVSPRGIGSGVRMIQYFINRGGKGLSATRRAELEKAKRILQRRAARQKGEALKICPLEPRPV